MRVLVHLLVRDKKKFLTWSYVFLGLYVKSINRAHSKWCCIVCALYATKRLYKLKQRKKWFCPITASADNAMNQSGLVANT